MKRYPLIAYFSLTFAITWGIALVFVVFTEPFTKAFGPLNNRNPIYWLAIFSPSIAALIVTARTEGRPGVVRLLQRLIQWRFGLQYYLLVLIGLPLLGVLVGTLNNSLQPFGLSTMLAFILTDAGPLGEELGWRGFALPRLLERYPPLNASFILGFIWGLWHLPAFAFSGLTQGALGLPVFLLGALTVSILATGLFRVTQGSVLITVLLHMMVNMSINVIAGSFNAFTLGLLIVAGVIVIRMVYLYTSRPISPIISLISESSSR